MGNYFSYSYNKFMEGYYEVDKIRMIEKEKEDKQLLDLSIWKETTDTKKICCFCFNEGLTEYRCLKCNKIDIMCKDCALYHAKRHPRNDGCIFTREKRTKEIEGNLTGLF
tara:strand:+ start:202 stop:531 length:330 start_codon:yes stop_codon:yes gene_type:complete